MYAAPGLPQRFRGRGLRVPSAASSTSESGARSDVHSHLRVPSNCREFGLCLLRKPLPPAVSESLYFLAQLYTTPYTKGKTSHLSSDFPVLVRQLESTMKAVVLLVGLVAENMSERPACIVQPEANILLTSTLASDDPIDSDPLLTMPPSVLGVCLGNINTDCGLLAINLCLAMVAKSANLNPGLNVLRSLVNYRYDGQGLLAFSMRMRDLSIALQSAFHYPGGGTSGVHPLATPPVVIDLIMKSLQEAFFDHSDTVRAE